VLNVQPKPWKKPLEEKMMPASNFSGSDKNKLGTAGQWRNKGPKKNSPAKQGDLVGGAAESVGNEHIVKVKGGYELKSKHGNKNLGKYPTRAGAEKRERQVQYFKHAGEDRHIPIGEHWESEMSKAVLKLFEQALK
jgi:hypothetical protein